MMHVVCRLGLSLYRRTSLNKYMKEFDLGGAKKAGYTYLQAESVVVMHIMEHDPQHTDSPGRIASALGQKGIHVKR